VESHGTAAERLVAERVRAALPADAFHLYPNAQWLGPMRDGGPPRDGEADLDLASLSRGHVLLGADAPRELVLDAEALESPESIRRWVERAYAYWLGDGTRGAPRRRPAQWHGPFRPVCRAAVAPSGDHLHPTDR